MIRLFHVQNQGNQNVSQLFATISRLRFDDAIGVMPQVQPFSQPFSQLKPRFY